MTEIFRLYEDDREAFQNKLKDMSVEELLSNLDDTIQIDMLKMNNVEWAGFRNKKVYLAIINELRNK